MFVYNWYIGGFLFFYRHMTNVLERFDRTWAFQITLKNLFQPMYQDQTIVGRILGFIFRSFRIVIAGTIYAFVILVGISLYVMWAAIPLYIISRGLGFA